MFNLSSEEWEDRSGVLTGDPSLPRYYSNNYTGIVAAAGKLYVHGGLNRSEAPSELLNFALYECMPAPVVKRNWGTAPFVKA